MLETFLDFFQERILKQRFELQTQAIETFSVFWPVLRLAKEIPPRGLSPGFA